MIQDLQDICVHRFIVSDNELVCSKCGLVQARYDNEVAITALKSTKLFHVVELGSKSNQTKEPFIKYGSMRFSIVCDKLRLPLYVSLDAWNLYNNIKGSLKNGDAIFISIYISCINNSINKSEEEIINVIRFVYNIKNIHSKTKIMNKLLPYYNIKIHEKMDEYYLRSIINEVRDRIDIDKYTLQKVSRLYNILECNKYLKPKRIKHLLFKEKGHDD